MTTSTTANTDITSTQPDGDEDGDDNKCSIVDVNSSSCNRTAVDDATTSGGVQIATPIPIVEPLAVVAGIHQENQSSHIPTDVFPNVIGDDDINNNINIIERIRERKASDELQVAITIDSNLHDNEKQDQVVDDANNNTATNKHKRTRRVAPPRLSWDDRMASLITYKEAHGHLQIPIRYKENPSLGKFVHNTREQYKLFNNPGGKTGTPKRCSLTMERIDKLNQIGFIWTTERVKKQNDDWNTRFEQLKEYKAKHGDCLVPHGYDADPSFAEWIHRQRTSYASMRKEEKPNPLVESRVKQLEEIGFNFTVHTDKWMDQYLMLSAYKAKHGDCQVPTHYAENPKLGRWTHTQRHQRRLNLKLYKTSCISDERIALLDKIGFNWEVRPAVEQPRATWQQRYEELCDHHQRNGNFLISPETHPKLYRWCCEQRGRLKSVSQSAAPTVPGSLSPADTRDSRRIAPDRVTLLSEIGFTKNAILSKPNDASMDLASFYDATSTLTPFALNRDDTESVTDKVNAVTNIQLAIDEKNTSI